MLNQYLSYRALVVWLVSLLLVSLTLVACGGTAEPVSEEPAPPAETEEAADAPAESADTTADEEVAEEEEQATATEEAAPTQAAATEEAAPTEEQAAAEETAPTEEAEENLSDAGPATEPTCQAIDIPDNPLIAPVSDSDWSKGPADAPITIIEYSDFQ